MTEPTTIVYVHALSLGEPEDLRADVLHLEAVAIRAFGTTPTSPRCGPSSPTASSSDDREEAS